MIFLSISFRYFVFAKQNVTCHGILKDQAMLDFGRGASLIMGSTEAFQC